MTSKRQPSDAETSPAGDDVAPGPLVVIGSSAGGIEALSILVGTLPDDFPAPILVAQHLDRRRESHLADILTRRTSLPVVTVSDRAPLTPGTIHAIPPNRHVSVTDHEVSLVEPPSDGRPVPSVDHLLATAADKFGEGLIGVILTGTGSDGVDGARRVKAAGGTVVIQDPDTARYPSMPQSLPPTTVDIVASIETIGPLLHELVTGARRPGVPEEERLLETFLQDVRDKTGIDFSAYKRPTILRRLSRRFAATRTSSLREYIRYLGRHPDEYQRLTATFLVKVTEFFRDPELFDHLRTVILPKIVEDGRKRGRELRLWSAGCATGEEPYSLAMLVADVLGDELPEWRVRVFATDLDADAVAFARRGRYPASAVEDVPPDVIARHFTRADSDYEVRKETRALTVFGQHDLAQRAPFPRIDLALCRNVLIYFTPELQRRALQLFAFSLRDGGWLALGKAETTNPLAEFFVLDESRMKIFRRRGERMLVPPMRLRDASGTPITLPRNTGGTAATASLPLATVAPGAQEGRRGRTGLEKSDSILSALPVGIALVDRRYDIVEINPAARRVLGIHGAAVGQDLIHLVSRLPGDQLRAMVDDALAGGTASTRVGRLSTTGLPDTDVRWVEVSCYPAPGDGPSGEPQGAIVVVRDASADMQREQELDDAARSELEKAAGLAAQIEAYREANQRLLRDNEELTVANAELRAGNEEMMVATEEVQAATEEVETLNEELQATNEELETMNEELQATVEELNTTNDDMQARAVELQQVTIDLEEQRRGAETERARLATVIEAMRDGVLVVDRAGRTVIVNAAYNALTDQVADAVPDTALDLEAIRARVAAGEELTLPLVLVSRDGRRRWFEAYGRPVPAGTVIGEGGILVVHDTTDISLRRLQQEFVGVVAHELRTPLTALRGYLQMLARRPGDEAERVLPLAISQADRLERMVEELFDVTRVERGRLTMQPDTQSLRDLVAQTTEIAAGVSERHRITFRAEDGDVIANVDAARIQQVLLNLLMNAIVHAPDAPEIEVRLRRLRRRVEIEVEDHGPGIPAEEQSNLFSPFEQGRGEIRPIGLGLGLYIAREIVVAHGGSIDVDSAVGEGTTFTVRLPLPGATRSDRTDGHAPGTVPASDGHSPDGEGATDDSTRTRRAARGKKG